MGREIALFKDLSASYSTFDDRIFQKIHNQLSNREFLPPL